jgi:hypothetical protein
MNAEDALKSIPDGLREPLLAEYREITKNYAEHRWNPSELSGGRFSEVVYTILDGHARGTYAAKPSKPTSMIDACRLLERNTHVPRSFQILIPRMLPALYEVRNQRGVGHVGGDVDPNHMDATVVLSTCNWIMAELVRVLHNLSTDDAQGLVDALAERTIPLIWSSGQMKRVLDPSMRLEDQILLLTASAPSAITVMNLFVWVDYENKAYFMKLLRQLHAERKIELSKDETRIEILPPGAKYISDLIAHRQKA